MPHVRKSRPVDELLDVIHQVAAGGTLPTGDDDRLPPLDELVVHYQPILELVGHRVVGFEALVRWQHPRLGLLPPGRFLPLAEESGYEVAIGRHVGAQAVADLARWHLLRSTEPPLWVSVNVSAFGLTIPRLANRVQKYLAEAHVAPSNLVMEITETGLLQDTPEVAENLRELKRLGVRLALDDFGTGFSSLSYLRRVPFDHIKIDTSFTAELPGTHRAVLLAEAIQQLAGHMGAAGVAEGIERLDQESCLVAAGWRLGQGFLYSPAVPFAEASEIVRTGLLP